MRLLKWLYPGIGIKRWVLLVLLGVALASLGTAVALDVSWKDLSFRFVALAYRVTKQYVPNAAVGAAIAALGIGFVAVGLRQTIRSVALALNPHKDKELIEIMVRRRQLQHGPSVVALGGGTGLPTLLRGLKENTSNITAVVTVADDGGSSGWLRQYGFPPPGDIRNCLIALADAESLMAELFQHRFDGIEALEGHAFGNLLLAAMTTITGDFERAIKETSKVLAIRGRVLPSTLGNVILAAELENGEVVRGQMAVNQSLPRVRRAFLEPENAAALEEVVEAVEQAKLIVIGPGSLYSSVIPNLLVEGLAAAIRAARVPKVYVCNVMTQPHETDGYAASDHVEAVLQHGGERVADYVLVNMVKPSEEKLEAYRKWGADFVYPDLQKLRKMGLKVLAGDFINESNYVRHDSSKLAQALFGLVNGR